MAETPSVANQRRGPAWLVVAVQDEDVALIGQNSLARIITGEHPEEAELFAESERAEESSSVEAQERAEEELAEALLNQPLEAAASPIRTSVGEEAVLAVLEDPAASELFVLAPDAATQQWLADHGQGDRDVLPIDDLEAVAAPHIREHAAEPLERLRTRSPEDALARAMQTGSRAFWALNADIAKDKHGITARIRGRILSDARASVRGRN
jgi:hypothetical protein